MDYLNGKNLRIRHRTSPEESSTLYFDKYEIIKIAGVGLKRSIYHGGKVVLFIGDLKECRSIAKDLGFKPLFSINKGEGGLIHKKLGKYLLKTFIENTSSFGWSGEIEYDGTPKEIAAKLRADIAFLESIGIKRKDLTGDPLSVLYARSAHFI
jgi:hypothetical protein